MSAGFFKGTSTEQDQRFGDKQKKLLSRLNFPAEYERKVDLTRVRLELIRPWLSSRISELLGFEDEVVVDLAWNTLEAAQKARKEGRKEEGEVDPRELQINLTGFLEKNAKVFVSELWAMMVAAQDSPNGIPPQLLEAKKNELMQVQKAAIEAAKAAAVARGITLPPPPPAAASTTAPPALGAPVAAALPASGNSNPPARVSRFGPKVSDVPLPGVAPFSNAPFPNAAFPLVPPMGHPMMMFPPMPMPSTGSGSHHRSSSSRRRHSRSRSRSRSPRRHHHSSRSDRDRDREHRSRRSPRSRSRSRDRDRERRSDKHRSSRSSRSSRSKSRDRDRKRESRRHHGSRSRSRSRSRGRGGAKEESKPVLKEEKQQELGNDDATPPPE